MIERVLSALLRRMREVLIAGNAIVIVGWKDSNHNSFTRRLPAKQVIFAEASVTDLPRRTGLVLFTRFVDHTVVWRIRKRFASNAVPIDMGKLKRLLHDCSDILLPTVAPESFPAPEDEKPNAPSLWEVHAEILDYLTQPRSRPMNAMERFIKAFLAKADMSSGACVGKKHLGQIRRETGVSLSPPALVKQGWLVPIAADGQQVGRYRAGEKMFMTSIQQSFEPEEPMERAKWMIAQESVLLNEEAELSSKLEEVRAKLKKIELAKQLLQQLKDLVGTKTP